ncbi:DEAD/DEAH box helicase family protein [Clostridium beijerinckii]|uniref:DEAD/DEAH box helicase family protein n=2 Tax=Bacteria TaxID=2 RepID=UPI00098C76B3|nr:DEAD/DEAH box helicase family protein [Clostridium beijerinckii]MZK53468.1 terminase B [Clostridium beijerinckii]MZK61606.1 terminase B [Clostridium beijerinckii]MZK71831.1 terminase B [Clostridium beijerinckii]MZK77235.1 terminase B [Clostridium beijerinckii]MZK86314.1 terminase B [Clostridium beijerinckii]
MDKSLITLLDTYWDNPVWFAEDMMNFHADKWQSEVLMALAQSPKVSVRSGQGVGKTGLESIVVTWYLCTRPFPKVIATAPTRQQLYDVLWAEISKWLASSKIENLLEWTKTKIYMKGYSERWWATAKTATRPENMQGFHEDYMLFVVDEASGVADPIMEAILGTLTGYENKLLMCGNPTRTSGTFYDSHNRDRDLYKTFKVSSLDSPRTSKDNIEMLRRKYHEGSDPWRVRVLGEFPKGESDSLISLEAAEMATTREVNISNDYILNIGADIARYGDDETIIAPRIGGKVFNLLTYSKQSTMETSGRILRAVDEFKSEYPQINRVKIKTDDDGLGAGVTDRLKEVVAQERLNYEIIPIQNGSSAIEKDKYYNKASEMWDVMRGELDNNLSCYLQGKESTVQLPNDDKLIKQLSNRKYSVDSKGKIQIESKKEMKKRIGESPDRADAVIYSFAENSNSDLSLLKGGRIWG